MGTRALIQQTRDDFSAARDNWSEAKTRLASLQATHDEKMALAEDVAEGRARLRGSLDQAKELVAEIQELKTRIEETKKQIYEHRAKMDNAIARFEELEGVQVLDKMSELKG
jgi:uncharacterized coiled-coil DUF342 family protein